MFTSGAEEGDEGWALDGFRATTGTEIGVFDTTGVKVPDTGTRIRVVSVGTSMRIGVSSR